MTGRQDCTHPNHGNAEHVAIISVIATCDDAWQKIEGHLGHLRGEAEVSAAGNFPFAGRVTGQLTTFEHLEYSHLDIKFSCSMFALGPKQAIKPPPRVVTDETKRQQSVLLYRAGLLLRCQERRQDPVKKDPATAERRSNRVQIAASN